MFTAWAVAGGERFGGSAGRSKKEAEQRAAEEAWRALSQRAVDLEHPEASQSDARRAAVASVLGGAPVACVASAWR
jgi:ribonuclease-3